MRFSGGKVFLLLVGFISIIAGAIIGFIAYKYSFEMILDFTQRSLHDKAKHLSESLVNDSNGTLEEKLAKIEEHWRSYELVL